VLSNSQTKRIRVQMNPLRKRIPLSDRELADLCLKLYLKYEMVYINESQPGETTMFYIFPKSTLKQVIDRLRSS
jgi:hypothetical protein